ncbi:MAG: 16S rRNA processing protein RimM [Gammaproteobacteria bacterium]|nr:16S rRNA processing protein RimM [Gammaproteobacteria bacterium]
MEAQTNSPVEWLEIGRIKGPHGVKGMLQIKSYTEPYDNLLKYCPLHIRWNDRIETLPLERTRLSPSHKTLLAFTPGCRSRDQALQWKGRSIVLERKELPALAPQQFYWSDLIGLNVVTTEGEALGIIQTLLPTGAHDVLVVHGKGEHLIPYIPNSVIRSIDLRHKTLIAHWDFKF